MFAYECSHMDVHILLGRSIHHGSVPAATSRMPKLGRSERRDLKLRRAPGTKSVYLNINDGATEDRQKKATLSIWRRAR
jgi:hypothetical protein